MAEYTYITEIVAPTSAAPGETVEVIVRIKNTYTWAIDIMAGGALEHGVSPWPTINFPVNQATVGAGLVHSFLGYFTMPDADVNVHAYSYYWSPEGWVWDDEAVLTVWRAAQVPEVSQFAIASYSKV